MKRKKYTFTLIEMVMVILLVAILSVVVVSPENDLRLKGVSKKLIFDIRYAQQLAISRHINCGVSFSPASNSYFVYIGNTSTKAKDPHSGADLLVDFSADNFYQAIDLVSTNFGNLIYFDSMGIPYSSSGLPLASSGIIVLTQGNFSRQVLITPNTGFTKFQ